MDFKEVQEALGLEGEIKTKEQLLESANKRFVVRSMAFEDEEVRNKATGKVSAILARKVASLFELAEDEVKDRKVEDIIALAHAKVKSKIEAFEIDSKKNKDELVTEWQSKYEKAKKEALEYKSSVDNFTQALKQKEEEFSGKEKSWKLNAVFSKEKSAISSQYHSQVKELELIGFDKKLSDTYTFDIGENDEVLIYNKATKERVADTSKMGSFITLGDLLKSEAAAAGLLKKAEGTSGYTSRQAQGENGSVIPKSGSLIVNKNLSEAAKRRLEALAK
jgi:hypothetical protein